MSSVSYVKQNQAYKRLDRHLSKLRRLSREKLCFGDGESFHLLLLFRKLGRHRRCSSALSRPFVKKNIFGDAKMTRWRSQKVLEKFTDDLLFPGIEGLRNEKHFFIKNKNCLFWKIIFYSSIFQRASIKGKLLKKPK